MSHKRNNIRNHIFGFFCDGKSVSNSISAEQITYKDLVFLRAESSCGCNLFQLCRSLLPENFLQQDKDVC